MLHSLTATVALLLGRAPTLQLQRISMVAVAPEPPATSSLPTPSLAEISAAPDPAAASFDVAEQLSAWGALPHGPWRHAFRNLITSDAFVHHGWAKEPFKLDETWPFAVGAYTMDDVARDITLLPPQFVAHGVEVNGGIYNKPMADGFSFADVDVAMDGATVVMLNAGFVVPRLARVSLAMLEASQLPIWLNVYLSKPGLTRSTQLHTDKQDVLLIQSTGRKRWRVYRPPPPSDAPTMDPFARGKGTDALSPRAEDLLIDTVMAPGEVCAQSTTPRKYLTQNAVCSRHRRLDDHSQPLCSLDAYARCCTSLLASLMRQIPSARRRRRHRHSSPTSHRCTSPSD